MGDEGNCLDPEAGLKVYSPAIAAQTGEDVMLRLFANRRNQAMRFNWTILRAPEGSRYAMANAEGTVTISTPFEYRYLEDEIPTFTPDVPGEYEVRVQVETIWEDRVSSQIGQTAEYSTVVNASGESVELDGSGDVEADAAGCQTAGAGGAGGAAGLGLLSLLGLVGLRRRRRA